MGQLCIGETTIVLLCKEGIWIRFGWWKQQGYWLTWSIQKRFSERIGYEFPIWQIGKGKRFRVALFFMETPGRVK